MQTHLRTIHQFFFLLAICYPITAFSSSHTARFATTRKNVELPCKLSVNVCIKKPMNKSTLLLGVPRGGSTSGEVEEAQSVAKRDKNVELQSASLNFIPPLAAALQCVGTSYSNALGAFPILTKSLTACATFFLSDYTAQRIERPNNSDKEGKNVNHDWTRTLTSAAVGLLYFGPAAHAWYEMIFKLLPGTSLFSTLQKAVLGQLIFGPAFTCVFFATSLLQGGTFTINNWVKKIKSDLPGAWLAGVGFWPLVDFVSYALVPIKFIPLFINLCSFVWTIYLSIVANRRNDN